MAPGGVPAGAPDLRSCACSHLSSCRLCVASSSFRPRPCPGGSNRAHPPVAVTIRRDLHLRYMPLVESTTERLRGQIVDARSRTLRVVEDLSDVDLMGPRLPSGSASLSRRTRAFAPRCWTASPALSSGGCAAARASWAPQPARPAPSPSCSASARPLQLNLHFHLLAPEGVFTADGAFVPLPPAGRRRRARAPGDLPPQAEGAAGARGRRGARGWARPCGLEQERGERVLGEDVERQLDVERVGAPVAAPNAVQALAPFGLSAATRWRSRSRRRSDSSGDPSRPGSAAALRMNSDPSTPELRSYAQGERTPQSRCALSAGSPSATRASSGVIGSRPMSRAIRAAFSTSGPLPFAIWVPASSR